MKRICSIVLVLCMLLGTFVTMNIPTIAEETTYSIKLDPGYLEFWIGFPLDLTLKTVQTGGTQTLTYYSTDTSVVTVDNKGSVTGVGVGTAYIYAKASNGTMSNQVEVKVIAEAPFDNSNPNQLLTLEEKDKLRNASDGLSWPTGSYGSAKIASWYNNTKGVFTQTADDNLMGDFPQWLEWYETYGVPTTLMAPTSSYWESGNYWNYIFEMGMEVQSHSHYHRSAGTYSGHETTTAQDWMDFYGGWLDVYLSTGVISKTIAYPCGYNNAPYSKLIYIGGRGTEGYTNGPTVKYNQTASKSGVYSISDLYSVENGGWYSIHQHNIGTSTTSMTTLFAEVQKEANAGNIWATTFSKASMYGQERDSATLTIQEATSEQITFSLTDKMMDSMFDQELTIKILVDNTWSDARAFQNGTECTSWIVQDGTKTYVLVNAIPDRGDVVVLRNTITTMNKTSSSIQYTISSNATSTYNTKTTTIEVDSTWTRVYATQNGVRIPASVETVPGGKTYVYATCVVNAGEVTINKTTSNIDLTNATSITMTDVYNNECTPISSVPVTLSTIEEWNMLAELVQTGKQTFAGITIVLQNNLDFSGVTFNKVGWEIEYSSSSGVRVYFPFSGTFDGNGYTFSGINLATSQNNQGVFGTIAGATIKNLDVEATIYGFGNMGGIVGNARTLSTTTNSIQSTIENCSFTGSVIVDSTSNSKCGSTAGGIVGNGANVKILSCTVSATITANTSYGTGNNIGGIAGSVGGDTKINNCSFVGTISGNSNVGGLTGTTSGNNVVLQDSYVNATITGSTYVGGLVGRFSGVSAGKLYNCVCEGSVTGTNYVGGAVGYMGVSNRMSAGNLYLKVQVNASITATTPYVGVVAGNVEAGNNATGINYAYVYGGLNDATLPMFVGTGSKGPYVKSFIVTNANLDGTATANLGTDTYAKHPNVVDALNDWVAKDSTATSNSMKTWSVVSGATVPTPLHLPTFEITFNDKDGNLIEVVSVAKGGTAIAPNAPDVENYVFTGWTGAIDNVKKNSTVQAQYAPSKNVTFLGYEDEVISVVKVEIGKTMTTPEAPEVEGYRFIGWVEDTTTPVITDLTIHANYEARALHHVTFLGLGGKTLLEVDVYDEKGATAPTNTTEEGYSFEGWDVSFDSITTDLTVHASYKKLYTVNFYEKDGTTLIDTQIVKEGENATAPNAPKIAHEDFVNWSVDFTNVQNNLNVVAQYQATPQYKVTFYGFENVKLDEQMIYRDENATAPEAPSVTGYKFISWDVSYSNIQGNVDVHAVYKKYYVISFYEQDGVTLIENQDVFEGENATAPTPKTLVGKKYIGWNVNLTNVQSNLTAIAQYENLPLYKVTFKDADGTIIGFDQVYQGSSATAPRILAPQGKVFSGWSKDITNVQSDLVVVASYKDYVANEVWNGLSISSSLVGAGTEDHPYQIMTVADFAYFIQIKASQATSNDFFEIKGDLYINGSNYSNTFTVTPDFAGHLNGNGYSIYNLKTNGLFGTVTGTIENVKIVNAKENSSTTDVTVLANTLSNATLKNIQVLNANIKGLNVSGLVKNISGTCVIENCIVSGTIESLTNSKTYHAAGFVTSISSISTVTFKNCINDATVIANTTSGKASGFISNIGSISSASVYNEVTLDKCINNGAITSNGSKAFAAGFMAQSDRFGNLIFQDCANNGTITTTQTDAIATSGFVGKSWSGTSTAPATIRFFNSVNAGVIVSAGDNVAGFFAYPDNINSKDGAVKFYGCSNLGTITGRNNVGGFVGKVNVGYHCIPVYLYSCVSAGDITATENFAGGVIGYDTLNNSDRSIYLYASVMDCNITAKDYAGAIVGFVQYSGSATWEFKFDSCFIKAQITTTDGHASQLIGGCPGTVANKITTNKNSGFDITVFTGTTQNTDCVPYYATTTSPLTTISDGAWSDGTALGVINGYITTYNASDKNTIKLIHWTQGDTAPQNVHSPEEVEFQNEANETVFKHTYSYGEKMTLPEGPTKASANGTTYTFVCWKDCTGYALGSAVYKPEYLGEKEVYTITFTDEENNVLFKKYCEYGETVTPLFIPTKEANETYTYAFNSWDHALGSATANDVYIASFTPTYIEYVVIFKNDDGTELSNTTYHFGDTITLPQNNPTKEDDVVGSYVFKSWNHTPSTVSADETFVATYTITYIDYTVTFKNEDGTVLQTKSYHYGDTVVAPSATKASTNTKVYTFAGWDSSLSKCEGNKTYQATYTEGTRYYKVTFKNGTAVYKELSYEYNETLELPTNPTKQEDSTYVYTFDKWSPDVVMTITQDATYVAEYTKTYSPAYLSSQLKATLLQTLNSIEDVTVWDYDTIKSVADQIDDLLTADRQEVQTLLTQKQNAYLQIVSTLNSDYQSAKNVEKNYFLGGLTLVAMVLPLAVLEIIRKRWF